jgi:hypothetical protein
MRRIPAWILLEAFLFTVNRDPVWSPDRLVRIGLGAAYLPTQKYPVSGEDPEVVDTKPVI